MIQKSLLYAFTVGFLFVAISNAEIVLRANDSSLSMPMETDKSDTVIIAISDDSVTSDSLIYDLTLSVTGGSFNYERDTNLDSVRITTPESSEAIEYIYNFDAQSNGLSTLELVTNKSLTIDSGDYSAGDCIYVLLIFEIPETGKLSLVGFKVPPKEEVFVSVEANVQNNIQPESIMMMASGPPPYNYFENPWECPDFNDNGSVKIPDFALFAGNWLETGVGLEGDFDRDDDVDIDDLVHFASYWLYDVDCPDIIYVKKNTATGDNGESWDTAYDELYTALSNADSNSQIWVAAGTYYPDPTGLGDSRDAIFALVAEAEVYGGWAGTESYLDERDSFENETIL